MYISFIWKLGRCMLLQSVLKNQFCRKKLFLSEKGNLKNHSLSLEPEKSFSVMHLGSDDSSKLSSRVWKRRVAKHLQKLSSTPVWFLVLGTENRLKTGLVPIRN